MIRIVLYSSNFYEISQTLIRRLNNSEIDVKLDELKINKQYHIYVIEVNNALELDIIERLKRNDETIIYVIGPESYEIASICIRKKVDLYFLSNDFEYELKKYKEDILSKIRQSFNCYHYKRNGVQFKIRLTQIEYAESLGHNIVIHSINGQFVERKKLVSFIDEVSTANFTRIHKSYVVNKKMIEKMTNKEVILKSGTTLPIGRVYKEALKI